MQPFLTNKGATSYIHLKSHTENKFLQITACTIKLQSKGFLMKIRLLKVSVLLSISTDLNWFREFSFHHIASILIYQLNQAKKHMTKYVLSHTILK